MDIAHKDGRLNLNNLKEQSIKFLPQNNLLVLTIWSKSIAMFKPDEAACLLAI